MTTNPQRVSTWKPESDAPDGVRGSSGQFFPDVVLAEHIRHHDEALKLARLIGDRFA